MARTYPSLITANSLASSTQFNDETVLQLQHILGFTLDGSTLNAITSPLELHNFTERVAPSTPSSGVVAKYVDSADGWMKAKNDAGKIFYYGQNIFTRKITLNANGEFNITLSDYEEASGATGLIIYYRLRSVTVATTANLNIRYNGDTATTKYQRQGNNVAAGAHSITPGNDQVIDVITAASAPANSYSYGKIEIFNLESGDIHNILCIGGMRFNATPDMRNNSIYQSWNDTSAITSFQIRTTSATDLASGSWIKLCFLKDIW